MEAVSIAATIELIKKAINVAKNLEEVEIKDALIASREALNEQREKNLLLSEKNQTLKTKLNILETKLKSRNRIKESIDCYEKITDDGKVFALCTQCWEANDLAVTLKKARGAVPSCPKCSNYYYNLQKNKYANLN